MLLGLLALLGPYTQAAEVTVCFTPEYDTSPTCTDEVVSVLDGARKTVLVQTYAFTSAPIAMALVDARRRGVDVRAILDRSNRTAHYSAATFLTHADIPVWIDAQHAIAHNKVIVVDGQIVISGSFNFTKAAEQENAENLLIIRDPSLAEKYTANWQKHLEHSELYGAVVDVASSSTSQKSSNATESALRYHGPTRGNKRTHIFHWPGCSGYDTIGEQNRVEFPSVRDAEAAGYRPARNCP